MSSVMARAVQPTFGQMENVSTPENYKLNFYFMSAKPEDIKVTLKGMEVHPLYYTCHALLQKC